MWRWIRAAEVHHLSYLFAFNICFQLCQHPLASFMCCQTFALQVADCRSEMPGPMVPYILKGKKIMWLPSCTLNYLLLAASTCRDLVFLSYRYVNPSTTLHLEWKLNILAFITPIVVSPEHIQGPQSWYWTLLMLHLHVIHVSTRSWKHRNSLLF